MLDKNQQGALLVMTYRAILHNRLHKLPNKKSHTISQFIRHILPNVRYPLHALAFENNKTFSVHRPIGLIQGLETYFTSPYTSQIKGTVENPIR